MCLNLALNLGRPLSEIHPEGSEGKGGGLWWNLLILQHPNKRQRLGTEKLTTGWVHPCLSSTHCLLPQGLAEIWA